MNFFLERLKKSTWSNRDIKLGTERCWTWHINIKLLTTGHRVDSLISLSSGRRPLLDLFIFFILYEEKKETIIWKRHYCWYTVCQCLMLRLIVVIQVSSEKHLINRNKIKFFACEPSNINNSRWWRAMWIIWRWTVWGVRVCRRR